MADPTSDKIERLCERSKKAWARASLQHQALREAYRWLIPLRYLEMVAGGQDTSKQGAYDHLYDPVGMQALADGASQIAEALHPWDQVWARWVPRTGIDKKIKQEAERYANYITEQCTALLNRSNFDGAAVSAHKEFLLGTGFLLGDRDPADDSRIRWTATPAYQWAIEADIAGRIQASFRKIKTRARDLDASVPGGTWSEQARGFQKDKPDTEIEYEMAIHWLPQEQRWAVCWYETQAKHEIREQVELTSPLICYRAGLVAGQAWGDGPGLQALPDVKVANTVVELVLRNAALAVNGMYNVADDGVVNPNNIVIRPGAVLVHGAGKDNGLRPVERAGDFDVSQLVLNDLRVNIRRALYVLRIEERDMTAEEYRGRLAQQMREQRGVYGQLKNEFVEQVMRRVLDLAVQIGTVQDDAGFEKLAQVELTGPLAADVRGLEVERFHAAHQDIVATVGPEIATGAVKLEEFVGWVVEQRHANPDLFRTKPELIALAKEIQEMVAQAQAAEQMANQPPPAEQPQPPPGMA
ncbi:MAG: hypothetical protein RJA36_3586 [Pseudomonadota bacterium]